MDCVSEPVYMVIFMAMWLRLHTHTYDHVNMSGGNHKSAERENLPACDLSNVPIRSTLLLKQRFADQAHKNAKNSQCNPMPPHITLHPPLVYFLFLLRLLVSL